jgi:hypothetical protein
MHEAGEADESEEASEADEPLPVEDERVNPYMNCVMRRHHPACPCRKEKLRLDEIWDAGSLWFQTCKMFGNELAKVMVFFLRAAWSAALVDIRALDCICGSDSSRSPSLPVRLRPARSDGASNGSRSRSHSSSDHSGYSESEHSEPAGPIYGDGHLFETLFGDRSPS